MDGIRITTPPMEWQLLEAVINLQIHDKRSKGWPTAARIAGEIRETTGLDYDDGFILECLRAMADRGILLDDWPYTVSKPLAYRKFSLHPDTYPEPPLADPYTEEEREVLRQILRDMKTEAARAKALAKEAEAERRAIYNQKAKEDRAFRKTMAERAAHRPDPAKLWIGWHPQYIDVEKARGLIEEDPEHVFILDTETTGLYYGDNDVLELSIIRGDGQTVISKRYGSWLKEWPDAQRIHGIAPEDVSGLKTLDSCARVITTILEDARLIIGYNVSFDMDFLRSSGVVLPACQYCDVMEDFARFYGQWETWIDNGMGGWKWQKLTDAARYYHIDTAGAHGSLKDCSMTLAVLMKLSYEPYDKRHRSEGEPMSEAELSRRGWD